MAEDRLFEQHEFFHRGSQSTYVPDPKLTDDSIVTGRIGRKLIVRDNEPPEEGMHERVHPEMAGESRSDRSAPPR